MFDLFSAIEIDPWYPAFAGWLLLCWSMWKALNRAPKEHLAGVVIGLILGVFLAVTLHVNLEQMLIGAGVGFFVAMVIIWGVLAVVWGVLRLAEPRPKHIPGVRDDDRRHTFW